MKSIGLRDKSEEYGESNQLEKNDEITATFKQMYEMMLNTLRLKT